MRFSYVVYILAILQTDLLIEYTCSALDRLIQPKCSSIVSVRVSRRVPYLETYKQKTWGIFYKTKARWNYRTQYYPAWHKEYKCCDGYRETSFRLCEPICQPACGNGVCVKPNICLCDHGYTQENDIVFDFICNPVCTGACVHGKCTAPEFCTCNRGYSLGNDSFTCEPICGPECGEGSYCAKPGHCACLSGYTDVIASDNERVYNRCDPVCDSVCVNGKCTAPNTCTCNGGYKLDPDDPFVCKPVCTHDCFLGTCTAPDVCTCNEGYSSTPDLPFACTPVCSEDCVNGMCVAPESCMCLRGYGLREGSKYVCEPVCEKACLNGRCTSPGVCTCHEGFRLSGDESAKHICEPHCEIPCEPFGVCIAPDVCACLEGYRLADKTQARKNIMKYFADNSVCKPICEKDCINGFCIAPNTCTCNLGYHPSGGNVNNACEPTCTHDCVNGFCSAPEICKCHEGFRRRPDDTSCEPICESDCINGHCSAPNECTCNPGYRPSEGDNANFCEPVCQPACEKGICVLPDVCNCSQGYRPSTYSANVCDPVCHAACERNGICKAPDLCVCEKGYRMVHHDEGNVPFGCEPTCNFDCGNGTCIAPDRCACFEGHRNTETGGCEPVCAICHNGTCVAPDVCECYDGYVLEESDVNGWENIVSTAGDVLTNGSRCVPRCENCKHGECVAPDECRCHAGFVNIEGICVDACEDGCGVHGECIDERRMCECNYGWTGPRCNLPTLCVLILHDEENRTESLRTAGEQNATVERVLVDNPVCSGCTNKVNNETLCFKMYINDTESQTQIGCLMDNRECLTSSNRYKDRKEIIKLGGIAGAFGILLLTSIGMAIYILRRKYRSRQLDLAADDEHSTSMQGLVEDDSLQ